MLLLASAVLRILLGLFVHKDVDDPRALLVKCTFTVSFEITTVSCVNVWKLCFVFFAVAV